MEFQQQGNCVMHFSHEMTFLYDSAKANLDSLLNSNYLNASTEICAANKEDRKMGCGKLFCTM